ncbi:hypothetical protein PSPO01_01108 [Paraphaeosphaeria sporulosa]
MPGPAFMQADMHCLHALTFNGLRCVDSTPFDKEDMALSETLQHKPSKPMDVGHAFHVWGTGRMAS